MTLSELAAAIGATLEGPGETQITGLAAIESAGSGQLTFVSNPKYARLARTTRASAILVDPAFEPLSTPTLRIANPYLAFARALALFNPPPAPLPGIHPTAVIAPTAIIGARAHIAPYVVIGDHVTLGDDAILHPHVVIYPHAHIGRRFLAHAHAVVREHCRLGDNVTLQNGAIIGPDGFGFAPDGKAWHKIPQTAPTVLEDDVEIQANACIDRASLGETRVRRGTKIDNLVQVGHGSIVGEDTLLCAQVGLAGSTTVGRNVILAGQVGVAGHCTVGDGAIATAQSGIPNDVPPGKTVSGYPAIDNRQWLRSVALFNRLPDLLRTLRKP